MSAITNNNVDDHEDDDCPTCIKRKADEDALTKEMLLIAPPNIRDLYEQRRQNTFELIKAERTPEQKARDEEERIKLGEFYKMRKADREARAKTGEQIPKAISKLDLEAKVWERNDAKIRAEKEKEQTTSKQIGAPKAKKPRVKNKPIGKKPPVKLGTITNPQLGPEMDCDD